MHVSLASGCLWVVVEAPQCVLQSWQLSQLCLSKLAVGLLTQSHVCHLLTHVKKHTSHITGGTSLREAFEQVGLAMFNYMTPIDALRLDDACTR